MMVFVIDLSYICVVLAWLCALSIMRLIFDVATVPRTLVWGRIASIAGLMLPILIAILVFCRVSRSVVCLVLALRLFSFLLTLRICM